MGTISGGLGGLKSPLACVRASETPSWDSLQTPGGRKAEVIPSDPNTQLGAQA